MDVNFIPSSFAKQQRNQYAIRSAVKTTLISTLTLALVSAVLMLYSGNLKQHTAALSKKKRVLSALLQTLNRDQAQLAETALTIESLHTSQGFALVTNALDSLQSIPANTSLDDIVTVIEESGIATTTLEGVSDSHKHLSDWIVDLNASRGVQEVELISSNTFQTPNNDALGQRFIVKIVHKANNGNAS